MLSRPTRIAAIAAAWLCFTVVVEARQDAVSKSIRERYDAMDKTYEAERKAFFDAHQKAETDEAKKKIIETQYPDELAYGRKFFALAEEQPKGPVTCDALYYTFQLVGHAPHHVLGGDAGLAKVHEQLALGQKALEWLARDYVLDPKMREDIQQLSLSTGPTIEAFLRDVLARNPDHVVQGLACQGLAGTLSWKATAMDYFSHQPEFAAEYEKIRGKALMDWLRAADKEKSLAEAIELHERVLSQYADVPIFPAYPTDKRTIAKGSYDWLATNRDLAIGKPAPPIDGKDVDGKSFTLASYRGKVVALVFWASWCGPCMEQIPHERTLAKQMEGKPFVLLGVNCDYKLEAAKKVLAKEAITWPNWYAGDPREEPPIMSAYHINGIPAIFVLDGEGIIRFKDVRGDALTKAVETLLKEQESKAATPGK